MLAERVKVLPGDAVGHLERVEGTCREVCREVGFAASGDFYRFEDYQEMEAVESAFREKHAEYVRAVSSEWGAPSFLGEPEAEGFPEWYDDAVILAMWRRNAREYYIALRKDDKELPYVIMAGFGEGGA